MVTRLDTRCHSLTLTLDLAIFSLQKMGGISVVWREYLSRLLPLARKNALPLKILLPENENMAAQELEFPPDQTISLSPLKTLGKYLPSTYRGSRNEILHMSYYRSYPLFQGKKVVTVHDFVDHYCDGRLKKWLHGTLKYRSMKESDLILCISETTREDLLKFHPDLAGRDIRVIANAVGDEFYPDPSDQAPLPPYLLWVGGRAAYKNFSYALQLFQATRSKIPELVLVVVGPPFSKEERKEMATLGLQDCVQLEHHADQSKLRGLYSNALALLYLSRYEGFGIPVLEAQRCRCPVICLPIPAMQEVARDTALYLTEQDSDLSGLLTLLVEPESREHLISQGLKNVQRYSWSRSFEKLMEAYCDLGWHTSNQESTAGRKL
ncbi:GDP-mannose:cellobiosyl-diphosphopolyprenol alpha-mannosyltransferase [compost metagenome]